MAFSIVSDSSEELKSQKQDVIELLERKIEQLVSGEITASHAIVILADMSDVETFKMNTDYQGRAIACLALVDLAKDNLRKDIFG